MRHSLLLLGVIAAMAIGAPAYSQYIYMDVGNGAPGNGVWTSGDVLTSASTQVDIYLNTNHNRAGTTIICNDGVNPLDIGSYTLMIRSSGSGSVTYGAWTNAMTGYGAVGNPITSGSDWAAGFSSASAFNPPALYKLGTLAVTVTGTPVLTFLTTQPPSLFGGPADLTSFGSECAGTNYPNTIALGVDFLDNNGTASGTPVNETTWGKIKQLYH